MNIYDFYNKHGDVGVRMLNKFKDEMTPNYGMDLGEYKFIFNEFFVLGLSKDDVISQDWMLLDDIRKINNCYLLIKSLGGFDIVKEKYDLAISKNKNLISELSEIKIALDECKKLIDNNGEMK